MRRNFRVTLLSFLAFSLLVVNLPGCASKEEKKAKHLEKARHYVEKEEFQKAVIEFKNVIQLDPQNDAACLELGEIYLKLKQGAEAFRAFSRAISINPGNMKAQLRAGQIFLLGKNPEEARKKAEIVLGKAPDDLEGLSLLSGVQVQEKDVEGAVKTLEKALNINPKDFNTRLSLARLFLMKGDLDKAEASYGDALSTNPKANTPYIELSRLYAARNEKAKAEETLANMIKMAGATYQNLQVLALFYESSGQLDKAEKVHLQSVEGSPKDDVVPMMSLASFYARRGSYEKALEAMKKALDVKKGDLDIMASIAQLQFDFKHMEEANAIVDQVLEKDKGHLTANFLKGRIYLAKREYSKAIEKLDLLVKERPRSDMVHYYRALALIQKGDAKLAEQDLVKVVELNPRSLDARLLLSETYLRQRDVNLARQQIEAALKLAPTDSRVITLNGDLKLLEKDPKGAEEIFKKLVKLFPVEGASYVKLGVFYGAVGRLAEAEAQLKKALELVPGQIDALAVITGIYIQQKRYDDALELCESQKGRIGENKSVLAFLEYLEGRTSFAKADRVKALQHFEKAIEANPNILGAYEGIAQIYVLDKKLDQAREQYAQAVKRNPKFVAGYMALGTINDQLGEAKKAEADYRKALEIDKDFAPAANNLAWNLIVGGGNIDEALGFAQTAKQKMPKNSAVMDTLGWVYYLKGSYLNAIAELQDAVQLDGNNADINYHLGMAYYKNKVPEKAKEFLEKALTIDQKFSKADEVRNILKEIETKS